ncbi:hypothetical protein NLG97_g7712 [Lecanicillium saksenae]|uniref:Uncharacterized protein n=1 Tax=Lecanicillium saksenae TaxID=468837 RepID=A0ACC1QL29_9HYPO|nr:hypothetical protein NLG97_g7712 [Lecanicillium saksenae]
MQSRSRLYHQLIPQLCVVLRSSLYARHPTTSNVKLVELLLRKGAAVSKLNQEKKTPYQLTIESKALPFGPKLEIARLRVDAGAKVQTSGPQEVTLLMLAASKRLRFTCRLLIRRGADPTTKDDLSHNVFYHARNADWFVDLVEDERVRKHGLGRK